jgi:hypothetical protein
MSGDAKLYVTDPPELLFTCTRAECARKGILAVYELPPTTNAGERDITPVLPSSYVSSTLSAMISAGTLLTFTGYTPSREEYTYTNVDVPAVSEIVRVWGVVPSASSVDLTKAAGPQRVDAVA